jgi:hypothetical protein
MASTILTVVVLAPWGSRPQRRLDERSGKQFPGLRDMAPATTQWNPYFSPLQAAARQ